MASISSLHPALQPWAEWMFRWAKSIDGKFVITSARRSYADQVRLRNRYLRGESKIYAAPPGQSAHQSGLAFDMARIGVDALQDPLLMALGPWWQYYGGRWGGAADPVHFGVQ